MEKRQRVDQWLDRGVGPVCLGNAWVVMPNHMHRFLRDQLHFQLAAEYTEYNPVTAGLCGNKLQWRFGSGRFRAGGMPALPAPAHTVTRETQ